MPDKKKKKPEYNAQERRMYNQYARHALSKGDDVEEMSTWVEKRRKKEKSQ